MGPQLWHILSYRALYLGLALAVLAWKLMPFGAPAGWFAAPDILLAITLAWVLRDPGVVPVGLVVTVFLLADFILQRPPGLWTALVLLATEFLRARRITMAETNFALEWAWASGLILMITLADRVVLWAMAAQQTTLGLALLHALSTMIIYPAVVLISQFVFGLRNLSLSETDPS